MIDWVCFEKPEQVVTLVIAGVHMLDVTRSGFGRNDDNGLDEGFLYDINGHGFWS